MADILKDLGDAITGFSDFARGKVGNLIGSDNERYGQNYDRRASPPSAAAASSLAALAEEAAKRNGIKKKPMTMSPEAKKRLAAK